MFAQGNSNSGRPPLFPVASRRRSTSTSTSDRSAFSPHPFYFQLIPNCSCTHFPQVLCSHHFMNCVPGVYPLPPAASPVPRETRTLIRRVPRSSYCAYVLSARGREYPPPTASCMVLCNYATLRFRRACGTRISKFISRCGLHFEAARKNAPTSRLRHTCSV
jgi:hypothetical protein